MSVDLHICNETEQNDSEITTEVSTQHNCICPPEYYCYDICGEAYTFSRGTNSLISWQHFPRSTSSRSACNDSSEEVRKSISETLTQTVRVEEIQGPQVPSTTQPTEQTVSQLNARHYLEVRHVFDLLNFLIGHLVCNEPEEPVDFLLDILEKCLKYRDSFGEPPFLFTPAHVKSMYAAFDPFERGFITMEQYTEAMKSLGLNNSITPYNKKPPLNEEGYVKENSFLFEAERCLSENLKKMLRIPKSWEDNRILCMKKMPSEIKKDTSLEETELRGECYEGEYDNSYKSIPTMSLDKSISQFVEPPKFKNEPEQLFLNDFKC